MTSSDSWGSWGCFGVVVLGFGKVLFWVVDF